MYFQSPTPQKKKVNKSLCFRVVLPHVTRFQPFPCSVHQFFSGAGGSEAVMVVPLCPPKSALFKAFFFFLGSHRRWNRPQLRGSSFFFFFFKMQQQFRKKQKLIFKPDTIICQQSLLDKREAWRVGGGPSLPTRIGATPSSVLHP